MSKSDPIYLDYNATAPIRAEVIDLMVDLMTQPGNASSVHGFGREARKHVENGRNAVAAMVKVNPNQLTFTSGATEANNAVLKAFAGEKIWVSAIEHPSVLEAAPDARIIPVTPEGVIDKAAFEAMLAEEEPALISLMLVCNETGVIQPVEELARMAKAKYPRVHIHTDAVQAAGRMDINFPAMQVDYMSLSAHKMGGPQGVGALIALPGARSPKMIFGGGQEKRQRAGTENVAGIAGFGKAAALAAEGLARYQDLAKERDRLEVAVQALYPDVKIYGAGADRVPNTSAICLSGVPASTQLMHFDLAGVAVSSGSACSSGSVKPSHVLQAMGASQDEANSTLRVSMGWDTKPADIDRFIAAWQAMFARLQDKISSAC